MDRYSSYRNWIVWLAHMKKDHGYSWAALKRMFPHEGREVWEDAKSYYYTWIDLESR